MSREALRLIRAGAVKKGDPLQTARLAGILAAKQTSALIPGTPANKYVKGKKVVYLSQDQAETVDRLSREYGKIFGFSGL